MRTFKGVQPPDDFRDPEFWNRAARYQLIYSLVGLVFGISCVIIGMVLVIRGVTGSSSWTASFIGLQSNISDAPPGVILFVVGLFVVYVTKFDVKRGKK